MVRTPCCQDQVQSLVRELRSSKLPGEAKRKKKRPCFWIRSCSQVLGGRTWTHLSVGHSSTHSTYRLLTPLPSCPQSCSSTITVLCLKPQGGCLKSKIIQKTKIMASGSIPLWQIDEETMETVTDIIFLGSKITEDGDCSHEIKRLLLLGKKAMTNLDSKKETSLC